MGGIDLLSCEKQSWRGAVDRAGTPVDKENGPEGLWCLTSSVIIAEDRKMLSSLLTESFWKIPT